MLNVSGSCALVRDKAYTVLINTGFDGNSTSAALAELGVKSIDLLILTGITTDCIGGVNVITTDYTVKSVILPDSTGASLTPAAKKTLKKLNEDYSAEIATAKTLSVADCKLTVLTANTVEASSPETYSLGIKLEAGTKKVLFLGTMSKENIEYIAENGDIKANVLIPPKYGSQNYVTQGVINSIAPDLIVFTYATTDVTIDNIYKNGGYTTVCTSDGTVKLAP